MYHKNIKKRKKKINLLQLKQCSQISTQSVFQPRYNKPNFKTDCSVIASILVMFFWFCLLCIWRHLEANALFLLRSSITSIWMRSWLITPDVWSIFPRWTVRLKSSESRNVRGAGGVGQTFVLYVVWVGSLPERRGEAGWGFGVLGGHTALEWERSAFHYVEP